MSSYIVFYLRPKRKEENEGQLKPMALCAFSRSSEIYQIFNDELNVVWDGNDDGKYTEITANGLQSIINSIDASIKNVKANMLKTKAANEKAIASIENISSQVIIGSTDSRKVSDTLRKAIDEIRDEYFDSFEDESDDYIEELESVKCFAEWLLTFMGDMDSNWVDFEGICCNID